MALQRCGLHAPNRTERAGVVGLSTALGMAPALYRHLRPRGRQAKMNPERAATDGMGKALRGEVGHLELFGTRPAAGGSHDSGRFRGD